MPRFLRFLALLLVMEAARAETLDDVPDHLWDLAAEKFKEALDTPDLP
ncbi:MAG: hypothetical protein RLZ97_48, partial [Verrucomicrobiota bacterium]